MNNELEIRKPHDILNRSTLNDLWKGVTHASALANDIDEIYSNIDSYWIDYRLKQKVGFGLKELRIACDELLQIHNVEQKLSIDFEKSIGLDNNA